MRLQCGFIDDNFYALGFDALHDALYSAGAEVIAARLHDEAVDANDGCTTAECGVGFGALYHFLGNEVFTSGVGTHNGVDESLWHVSVVSQQLLSVLGQAVPPVAKAGVVVVLAYARVQAHAVDDLARVQLMAGGVGIEFVEVGHPHGQVGIGKEFDGLGFSAICEQRGDVLLYGPLLQKLGEGLRML